MSMNLSLTKHVKPTKKGQKPQFFDAGVMQTPTELSNECKPFLSDRWRVFDKYQQWVLSVLVTDESWSVNYANEHLNDIRKALEEDYVWSWG